MFSLIYNLSIFLWFLVSSFLRLSLTDNYVFEKIIDKETKKSLRGVKRLETVGLGGEK